MARFNTRAAKAQPASRVTSTGRVLRTYEGGRGREREPRGELFLLAISNFVTQQTYYETGDGTRTRDRPIMSGSRSCLRTWTSITLGGRPSTGRAN